MMRARAKASATRDVSIVIQRRPHCSATVAVVPEPQVGSSTRSPGSVAINMQRFHNLNACLNDINLLLVPQKTSELCVLPQIVHGRERVIVEITFVEQG